MNTQMCCSSIDHVPCVVRNLDSVRNSWKNQLHFTVKEGKLHEGITNCFLKFQDGTYLEWIEPVDSTQETGKFYADFLKNREGGTSFAIAVPNDASIKSGLNNAKIPFVADSNKRWQTVEPVNSGLFFIEYADTHWKDQNVYTTHENTAQSLASTYILTDQTDTLLAFYRKLGFTEMERGLFLETPYVRLRVGESNLYVLDLHKAERLKQLLRFDNLQGICGFEIKVGSLKTLNDCVAQTAQVFREKDKTTVYLPEYHLFMLFKE